MRSKDQELAAAVDAEVLDADAVATICKAARETAVDKMNDGTVPGVKIGREWIRTRAALLAELTRLSLANVDRKGLAHAGVGRVPRTHVAIEIAIAVAVSVERHDDNAARRVGPRGSARGPGLRRCLDSRAALGRAGGSFGRRAQERNIHAALNLILFSP